MENRVKRRRKWLLRQSMAAVRFDPTNESQGLPSERGVAIVWRMVLPDKPVTLSAEQVAELNKKLSVMRHDINGDLALIVAAAELIKLNPSTAERMLATLLEQPTKIRERADKFSRDLEIALGIKRG